MENKILKNIIDIVRKNIINENMVVGTGGFSGSSDPKGPVAGFDPVIDGRSRIARRLPTQYRKYFLNKKSRKR